MRRTRLRDHSINRLIPNMLTLFALCAGLTSIKFALDANALMNVTLSTDQSAVADAAKTLRHIRWFEVVETRGHVENGAVRHFQVTLRVGFTLEG